NAPTLAGGLPYALWSGNNVVSHRDAHGDLVVERLPSLCHDQIGSDDFHANARTRYVTIVRDNGCTVPLVLTCASSDLDTSQGFAQYQRAKARHYGWFPLAACPLELVTGTVGVPPTLRADQLAISTDDVACAAGTYSEDAPCRHAVAEIQARRTRWNRIQQAREDEANKNAPATPEQIAAAASKGIGETLTKMFGELLAKTATEPAQAEPARVRKARTT
ncbi:MAG: hypothetical protein NT062_05160, partial [Proteobacteria bacterium]|nr:hypothetical protein [Pseudomonadota bacterium]